MERQLSLVLAYYCSGHGYGHATRVSALVRQILLLNGHTAAKGFCWSVRVHIVSSAPKHIFREAIDVGAQYRNANIDPVIVQPLAYRVDRERSVVVLKAFLEAKAQILAHEMCWLKNVGADCVLSDAAFIGCLAANQIGIPSILVTNFTFDSVYSYLTSAIIDSPTEESHESHHQLHALVPDKPVPEEVLRPLVEQICTGYRCADLLLRLPGYIPIPSFFLRPPLPSSNWVDPLTNRFRDDVFASLTQSFHDQLHPSIPYPSSILSPKPKPPRQVIPIPLLVRPRSHSISTHTGRSTLLSSIGIPHYLHDPSKTKILVVSFGGQVFRRPNGSKSGSTSPTPAHSPRQSKDLSIQQGTVGREHSKLLASKLDSLRFPRIASPFNFHVHEREYALSVSDSLATASHLWIPGAPPVSKPVPMRDGAGFTTSTSSDDDTDDEVYFDAEEEIRDDDQELEEQFDALPRLLPDSTWIAIVCGVSKDQWNSTDTPDNDLPGGFYIAPRDVYMPDLTATGDVLLGKLGYGTVAECVDSCTPFVYVSRPLFIEEHGLRHLLATDGVGIELEREKYEAGDWAGAVSEAYALGKEKRDKLSMGSRQQGTIDSETAGVKVAQTVLEWANKWR
ncbi:hypothetical protein MIND_00276300 [Mycena indigotica]|uniref:L-arabinokinase n=1 Tax=Mycena indigotica TaxID=2126181 RepID=A0A8H6T952_9AGAR|nr:uncharacterized protein MIND_00276300 [Mycena indigotica]KAF7312622.1 hypothetical protein MIND_00276300 [Mycena indigotica]